MADILPGIPAAWVTAGIQAAIAHHKRRRDAYWVCPSSEDAAAIIAGAVPLIVAAERERAERAEAALDRVTRLAEDWRRLSPGFRAAEAGTYILEVIGEGQERSDEKEPP